MSIDFFFLQVHLAFPIIYVLLTAVITILPMLSNPVETSIGIAMILSAFPVYFVFISRHSKTMGSFSTSISSFTQKFFLAVPEAKDEAEEKEQ